jgi:hypothetical protein
MIEDRWILDEGYRVELFDEQDSISPDDVLELWSREGAVPEIEARRRLPEVHLVGITDDGELAGLSTARIRRNDQLRMDLWFYRAFVAKRHRMSNLAVTLALQGRDRLQERFVGGKDPRENEGLKRYFNEAVWYPLRFVFIGENPEGAHVRVWYFPGALAPEPPR